MSSIPSSFLPSSFTAVPLALASSSSSAATPAAAATIDRADVNTLLKALPVREVAEGELKMAVLVTRIISKAPENVFSSTSLELSLLQLLVNWILDSHPKEAEEPVTSFLSGLIAGGKSVKDLFKEHLDKVLKDAPVRNLFMIAGSVLDCKIDSILRKGLPVEEPNLMMMLSWLASSDFARKAAENREGETLAIRDGQTLIDAIGEFYYCYSVPSKDPEHRDREKEFPFRSLLGDFLTGKSIVKELASPEKYPREVQILIELLSLLSGKGALKYLTAQILPKECLGGARVKDFEEELGKLAYVYMTQIYKKNMIDIILVTCKKCESWHSNDLGRAHQPTTNRRLQGMGIAEEVIPKSTALIFLRKLNAKVRVWQKNAAHRFSSINKAVQKSMLLDCLPIAARHLNWYIECMEEVEKTFSLLEEQKNQAGAFSFLLSTVGRHKALVIQVVKEIERVDRKFPAELKFSADFLLDLELEESPQPAMAVASSSMAASSSSPSDEVAPVEKAPQSAACAAQPKEIKKLAAFPSEQIQTLQHLLSNPAELIDGAISQTIQAELALDNGEVKDHLILATQGVELFCDLYRQGRYDLLGVCVHSYLIDCHVAAERHMSIPKTTHSLVAGAQDLSLNEEDLSFLKTHDRAILWTRYLAHFRGKAKAAAPVLWLDCLMKQPTKENAQRVLKELLDSYKGLLHFFGVHNPLIEKVLEQVKVSVPKEAAKAMSCPLLVKDIEEVTKSAVYVRTIPEGDPVEHLDELCNYVVWMNQAKRIQAILPHQKWSFLLFRIELHMDKLFKHLFAADCLLLDHGSTLSHHLKTYVEALSEDREITAEQLSLLSSINLGLSHHYMNLLSSNHATQLNRLLDVAKSNLSTPAGFTVPNLKQKPNNELKENIHKAYELLVKFVPATLERLQRREVILKEKALLVPLS